MWPENESWSVFPIMITYEFSQKKDLKPLNCLMLFSCFVFVLLYRPGFNLIQSGKFMVNISILYIYLFKTCSVPPGGL